MVPKAMEIDYEDVVLNRTNLTASPPNPDSLDLLLSLTITYSIIFVLGILGNISTCIVIARTRSMHTATNFWLFSLAISDLLLLLFGLPLEVYRLWYPYDYPLDQTYCIALGLASETSANATVLTITAFTVERYIAICRPFMLHTMSNSSRTVKFIIGIWFIALLAAAPQAYQFGIDVKTENGLTTSSCTVIGQGVHYVFVLSSFVFFVGPMSVITVLYVLIGMKLRMSRLLKKLSVESYERPGSTMRPRNGTSQRRVIKMLVAVALSFFICWAPFHVQRLLAFYGKSLERPTAKFYTAYIILTYMSGILYFLSTAINPFLYNIMSNKFRNAFKMTLAAWCRRRSNVRLGRTYSSVLASQRQRGAALAAGRQNGNRRQRLSTATTKLYDAPPRAQYYREQDISTVTSSSDWGRTWMMQGYDASDYLGSRRSISNSSLREVDKECTGEELATYMYQVNCDIAGHVTVHLVHVSVECTC